MKAIPHVIAIGALLACGIQTVGGSLGTVSPQNNDVQTDINYGLTVTGIGSLGWQNISEMDGPQLFQ